MIVELFNAMAAFEGYGTPGSKATRLNNPLNLRYAGQSGGKCSRCGVATMPGCITTSGGGRVHDMAAFESIGIGIVAGTRQLCKWIQDRYTLSQIIATHAPTTENPTDKYLAFVTSQLVEHLPAFNQYAPFYQYVTPDAAFAHLMKAAKT